ncbi:MAG: cytochrome C [Deltaproteobacteria bacterium]|nr:cytochrome C [Deltaproteobacteria bacterium]
MAKRVSRLWRFSAVCATILMLVSGGLAMVAAGPEESSAPVDIVFIDLPDVTGGQQMPSVPFAHDRHTRALGENKDCSACHLQQNNRFVFKFKRLKNGTPAGDMALYHENCVACHTETLTSGRKSGPLEGSCRSCHTQTALKDASAWEPIDFDKSLHYRHASSKAIQPGKMYADTNCSACHHIYDATIRKTVQRKGTEQSCLYCHKDTKTENASSIRWASHASCVGCHQQLKARSEKAGPVTCSGCHAKGEQAKIAVVEVVPRLERNQPDWVLLASWMSPDDNQGAAGDLEEALAEHMNPVAFNHRAHEGKTDACRSCHHASLTRCSQCHTEKGDAKGADVQLAQAMHSTTSNHSCIGCHNQATTAAECAGCHSLRPNKPSSQTACARCHAVDKSGLNPLPMEVETRADAARQSLGARERAKSNMADEKIPSTVKIDRMAHTYEAVQFPHRKIVRALMAGVRENKMAAYFHKDDLTLCAGCHHNAPATLQPSRCAACHGEAFKNDQDGRPGLKGAYHGQCMGCHQAMGIEEPAATDCTKCHKEKAKRGS